MNEKRKAEIILQVACEYFNEDVQAVKSPRRFRELADCRKAYSYVARRVTRAGTNTIGRLINKHHATVICASRGAEDLSKFGNFSEHIAIIEKAARVAINKEKRLCDYANFGQL